MRDCTLPRGLEPRLCCLFALVALTTALPAHGGQYRGPTEVLPPSVTPGSGSSGGSASAGGGGGSSPSGGAIPSAGSGGNSGVGGAATAGRAGGRGFTLDSDLTSWESWWEFRKDPLLRLRDGVQSRRGVPPAEAMLGRGERTLPTLEPPTATDVAGKAVPALHAALQRAVDRDTVTGCMVALAKIGRDPVGARLHELFRTRLAAHDQEVRETAALCLGIARQAAADDIELLLALLQDETAGREACARASVDERTRTFAGYALGLCVDGLEPARQKRVVDALIAQLGNEPGVHRNVTVAAIAALGQLPHPRDAAGRALRDGAATALRAFYLRELGPGEQLLQSHCPPVLARLVGRDHPMSESLRERFTSDLAETIEGMGTVRGGRTNHHIAQSLALALGELGRPWQDEQGPEAALGALLLRCYRTHKDQQTRYFSVLALGRLGGAASRAVLLRELDRGNKSLERPWIALALANWVQDAALAAQAQGRSYERDREIGAALRKVLDQVKNPSAIGATAIALGLCRETDAGDRLRAMLLDYAGREDVAGQLAIGLALLDERRAVPDLRAMLARSVRQPQLLVQLTTALGRLGDGAVVDELVAMLGQLDGGLARLAAVASAVGQIGDRRCIDPLVAMLENEALTPLTRAFAAVALGSVCDPDALPWNARYAGSLNYRAAVETLTDGAAGILDIL
ncbi:MAG: HEAT repeat domain-containing protein [Planctomycetota bacterium]